MDQLPQSTVLPTHPHRVAPRNPSHVRLLRALYTHNPFYLISAWLVFSGLRMSFNTHDSLFPTWSLTVSVAGYTLLLAASACVLIRLGNVWDDIRTLLLLVVLMFLGLAVTLDDLCAADPRSTALYCSLGLAFVVLVSEAMLRGLRLRLGWLFRVPYYLLLTLFFLYPISFQSLVFTPDSLTLQWRLFAFASLSGLAFLSLLPAVRSGAAYVQGNGSPWPWPWFPWTAFGFLAFGVCFRAYYLCYSFHFVSDTSSIFGCYFLAPFAAAISLLILEAALVSGKRTVAIAALAAPAVWIVLAAYGHRTDATYSQFLAEFSQQIGGSPLWLTLLAATGYFGLAALRGVRGAADLMAGTCALLAFVDPQSVDFSHWGTPQAWPLLVAGTWELALAIRRSDSRRWVAAAGALFGALAIMLGKSSLPPSLGMLPIHLYIITLLAIGACGRDLFARYVQEFTAGFLLVVVAFVAFKNTQMLRHFPLWVLTLYPLVMLAVALAYGRVVKNRRFFISGAGIAIIWTLTSGVREYDYLHQRLIGLNHIAAGIVFFLVALLISLIKAGVLKSKLREVDA